MQVVDGRRAVLPGRDRRRPRLLEQEHQLRAAAASQAYEVAVLQLMLGDAFAVDVGAVARSAIAQDEVPVVERDLGVIPRHIAANQLQIVAAAAADRIHRFVDVNDAATEGVGDLEATVRHISEAANSKENPAAAEPES